MRFLKNANNVGEEEFSREKKKEKKTRGAVSNFFSGISGDGICSKEATKILEEEGSALCEKFLSCPLSMVDKGEARTVTICTQTDRRASLSH